MEHLKNKIKTVIIHRYVFVIFNNELILYYNKIINNCILFKNVSYDLLSVNKIT